MTGASALAEEVLWSRGLRRLLGSTTGAQAAVLASLLCGMAAGSWLSGRAVRRAGIPRPHWALRNWAFAALASGAAALLVTAAVAFLEKLEALPGPAALILVLLLFAASVPWGAGFPFVAAAFGSGTRPRAVGALYGMNSLGGAAGALAVPFILPELGERAALACAASLQLAAGLGSLAALHLRPDHLRLPTSDLRLPTPQLRDSRFEIRDLSLVFIAGLAVIYWEIEWTRILVLVVGSSLYSFSMVAGGVVLGIGLGSFLWAGAQGGTAGRRLAPGILFLLAAAYFAVPYLPDAYLLGARALGVSGLWGPLAAGGLVLVACAPLGVLLPWAMANAPLRSGPLAAANGAGAALGALLAGPVLAGRLGIEGSYLLGLALTALLALCAAGAWGTPRSAARSSVTTVLILSGVAIPSAAGFFWKWDLGRLLSGVYQWPRAYVLERTPGASGREMLFVAEGSEAIVSVESDGSTIYVKANGKVEGTVPADPRRPSLATLPTQILLGALPGLLAPGGNAAVLGLGGGTTLGTALRSGLGAIDCLEIEPAFREALGAPRTGAYFAPFLGGALSSPQVRWWFGDARALLAGRLSGSRWDAFVSQPSEPWMSASAPLFTREFFARATGRLAPGGVFVQWLQLYKLPLDALATVVRTFRSALERVFVIRPPGTGELILLGTRRPLDLEALLSGAAHLEASSPGLLASAGLEEPADLLAVFLLGPDGVDGWLASGAGEPLNTDDRGLLEVLAPALLHEEEDLAAANLRTLRLLGGSDPISRYLPAGLRDAATLRRIAARNVRLGDFWEARALLEGDLSAEAASLRAEAEREIASQGEGSGKR